MAATAGGALIEEHAVDIKTVCSVGVIVAVGAWRLSKKFQIIDDRMDHLECLVKEMPCRRTKPILVKDLPNCENEDKK